MSAAKDIQTNGIHNDAPSTSGRLPDADDNANLNNDTSNHKGAIPKIKIAKNKFSKKSKFNNNVEDEPKSRVKNDLPKLNGLRNCSTTFIDLNYDICLAEATDIFNNGHLDDIDLTNMKNVQLIDEPISFRENSSKHNDSNSSTDEDLFSVSDDGCIYTYKGDHIADLPSSFFNLNATLVPTQKSNREQSSSPEMDFLEMDFDPGPSDECSEYVCNAEDVEPNNMFSDKNTQTFSNTSAEEANSLNGDCPKNHTDTPKSSNKTEPSREATSSKEQKKPLLSASKTSGDAKKDLEVVYHKLYPWLCSISERTTFRKDKLSIKRCHSTKGELLSPSEKMPSITSSKLCDIPVELTRIEEAMIWSEEEANTRQINQIGPSACGATAVLNVLNALRFPIPSIEELNSCVKTKLRANQSPLTEYLLFRSVAGTDHNSLIDGLQKLSNNQIYARFFHMYPERVINLSTWLSFWIKNGAVPIATLNLQKCAVNVPDAWHHQMIYGIGPKGIYLTNPLECVEAENLWPQLCSESVLLVRREDILKRWNIKTDLPQLMKIQDKRWRTMNVVGQVANMIHESRRELRQGFVNTSHIRIPAIYSSGITLAIKTDSPAYPLLKQCPELPELALHDGSNITPLNL